MRLRLNAGSHRSPLRRPFAAWPIWLIAALVLTACPSSDPGDPATPSGDASPAPSAGAVAVGGSLKYGLAAEPSSIDPAYATQTEDLEVVTAVFRSLTQIGPDGSVRPGAASSWEPNADATRYTFHLREGARFHDGTSVQAADVVRAWNRMFSGAPTTVAPNAYHLAPVAGFDSARSRGVPLSGVTAIDPLTVRVDLTASYEGFEAVVAHPSLAPVPPAAVEDRAAWAEQPVGNGPFAMAEPWQHDQFIRVVRFEGHLPTAAHLDEVVFRISSGGEDGAASYAEFAAGRLQVSVVPGRELDAARRTYGSSQDGYRGPGVVDAASATSYFYGFLTTRPPLDDPDVRRALSLLIDRDALATEVFEGTRIPATSIVPPGIPGHEDGTCAYCRFDPAQAALLLTDKGLATLTIAIDDLPGQRAVAERVMTDIEAATDVDVEIVERSFADHLAAIRTGDVELFRLGWAADHPSADNVLGPLFHSSNVGDTNVTAYANPATDALLDAARRTRDLPARIALWRQAEREVLDLAPLAPIAYYRLRRVVADEVSGLRFTPYGWADLSDVRLRS